MSRPFAFIMSLIAVSRPNAIGSIIAAVAVLLTHPEQSAVAMPMDRNMRTGLDPTHFIDSRP